MYILKNNFLFAFYLLMCVASLSAINKIAFILLPFFYAFLYFNSTEKYNHVKIYSFLLLLAFVWLIAWVYSGYYWLNWLVSTMLVVTFLLSMSFTPEMKREGFEKLIKVMVVLMLLHSVIGMVQYLIFRYDDAFIGFYGRSGLQGHGLAIVYVFLFSFLLYERRLFGDKLSIGISFVFMLSFFMCFYGTGIVHVLIAVVSVLIIKAKLSHIFVTLGLVSLLGWAFYYMNPVTAEYNVNIIVIYVESIAVYFEGYVLDEMPRRLVFIFDYIRLAYNDIVFFCFGSGPGTYNSRTSFLLNGEYSSLGFLPTSVHPLAAAKVFPLWDSAVLSQSYSDGSMNQPFSSLFAILAEYGALLGGLYLYLLYKTFSFVKPYMKVELWVFLGVFVFMLSFFENIIDYPEVLFPFVIIVQYFRVMAMESKELISGDGIRKRNL